jgi:hypothetical protein
MRSRPRSSATAARAPVARVDGDSREVGVAHDGDHRRDRGGRTAAGSRARLGDQTIIAGEKTAVLENGTLAGSILTMDAAFRMLVNAIGLSLPDAARMCATTPADAMKRATSARSRRKWADLAC